MTRIYLTFCLFIIAGAALQAQHLEKDYKPQRGPNKTWRDSGYYFVPTLARFDVSSLTNGGQGITAATVNFQSTDNSDLSFNGQATFFFRPNNLPPGVTINAETIGFATILLPQDLLYCPDEEQEQGMGQDDPYFPLSLVGRFERIGLQWLDPPSMISIQLNDFVVN